MKLKRGQWTCHRRSPWTKEVIMKKILVAINTGREGGNDLVLETADTLAKAWTGN